MFLENYIRIDALPPLTMNRVEIADESAVRGCLPNGRVRIRTICRFRIGCVFGFVNLMGKSIHRLHVNPVTGKFGYGQLRSEWRYDGQ